jgi:hypothetical protein
MGSAPIGVDVCGLPGQDLTGAPSQAPGDEPMWSPVSSVLNSGGQIGILPDLKPGIGPAP